MMISVLPTHPCGSFRSLCRACESGKGDCQRPRGRWCATTAVRRGGVCLASAIGNRRSVVDSLYLGVGSAILVSSIDGSEGVMEEPCISDPLIWKENEAEKTLIGKILSTKLYSRVAIERILQKAWNLESGFDVIEVTGNAFLFKFIEEEEYSRILRGRPWSINGCLLNLLKRSSYKAYEEYDFSRCPVWIQIHNIPLEAMCLENASMIGGYVGSVMLAEDPSLNGRLVRNFLRARVVLDLKKALSYGFWMNKPDGGRIWIVIRYEKLQSLCFNCGKSVHDNRMCKSVRSISVANGNEPCFGPWTTTNQCRNREEATEVVQSNWEEASYFRRKKEEAIARRKKEQSQKDQADPKALEEDLFFIKLNATASSGSARKSAATTNECSLPNVECDEAINSSMELQGKQNFLVVPQETSTNSKVGRGLRDALINGESVKPAASPDQGADVLCDNMVKRSDDIVDSSLAMVPFCGGSPFEVTNSLCGLGLKRGAEEDLVLPCLKKRKLNSIPAAPNTNAISTYAGNLRKITARTKRNGKRKSKGGKENLTEEELLGEEMMDVATNQYTTDNVFLFKARRGNHKKSLAEEPVGSDHHALVIDCCYSEFKSPRDFKFEANWVLHKDFLKIVKSSWSDLAGCTDDLLLKLIRRLEICRGRLVEWSKREFPNFRKVIDHLRGRLHSCYEGILSAGKLQEAENLVGLLEETWIREETYWWQRSRISWLKSGDQNTNFFHSSVIQCRQRNKILRLRSDDGRWLEDRREIHQSFSRFYKGLFSSDGARSMEQALSYVQKVVTDEDNLILMK
ncbi:hypothetical protein K1719_017581 [Acacia pycnantha]|nr:hypothetical protein K1719_017581 [Acacia pycnantha]